MKYPFAFEELIESFKKLPGIGLKSAERMAYKVLDMDDDTIARFSHALVAAKQDIHWCERCGHMTDKTFCDICLDESRDTSTICVVQSSKDVYALERSQEYRGVYHVLHGVISAVNGVGPQDITIPRLTDRVKSGTIKEIILATNPTVDGETTALYIAKVLENYQLNISRLAYGLPVGGNLDYADDFTLMKALQGRRKV